MRFSTIRSWFLTRIRPISMLLNNPASFISYRASRFLRRRLGNLEVPSADSKKKRKKNRINRLQERLKSYGFNGDKEYRDEREKIVNKPNSSLRIGRRLEQVRFETDRRISPSSSSPSLLLEPSTEEIPILTATNEIRGRNGRYKCTGEATSIEENYRIYPGVHGSTNKPVVIKEYLLLEAKYNREERIKIKKLFASVVDLNLRGLSGQDFRLILPIETIAPPREKRCYLITESTVRNVTLGEFVKAEGALSPKQVVRFLDQVLQTLWFVHTNRMRSLDGKICNGIAHGNLNFDSLLIDVEEPKSEDDEKQLFVCVGNLALWEHIFNPPSSNFQNTSTIQDLIDLGNISASVLIGKTNIDEKNWFLASEDEADNWLDKDEVLGRFILKLLGVSSKFESALEARQCLLQLEREGAFDYQQESIQIDEPELEEVNNSDRQKLWKLAAIIAIVSAVLGAFFVLFNPLNIGIVVNEPPNVCCIAKVELPTGKHIYAAENGIWNYLLTKSGFTSKNRNLKKELEFRQPELEKYIYRGSTENAIAQISQGSINFALGYWREDLPDDLEQEIIAFHGLSVFVAFGDSFRAKSIPKALRGKITLQELQTLYTKGIDDWKIPRQLRDWDVKLYVPFETETITIFKNLLFPDREDYAVERRQFDRLTERILVRQRKEISVRKNYLPTTRNIIEKVFLDYETNKTISIGFGDINSIFGQCAVYPLAVAKKRRAIQPYITSEGKPITPQLDLCNDKGGYLLNASEFNSQKYPLTQKLVVIYPKDEERAQAGKQFAQLLRTEESQYLLKESGIVPLQN